jgi:pimeloyl-ACP methyl ester carboxylesterase
MTLRRPVGSTGHARAWDTPSIAQRRHFHVVALDRRGRGDSAPSPRPPAPETWERMARAARHRSRGNPYPGVRHHRRVAAESLRRREDAPETVLAALRDFLGFA